MIKNYQLIELPKISDQRGNLTFIEGQHIPFAIKRIYYMYDIPQGTERGGHAHKNLQQVIIALSGSFDMMLDDGSHQQTITLDNPATGVYIDGRLLWRTLSNFSENAICLVLASDIYKESDYFRDYPSFLQAAHNKS